MTKHRKVQRSNFRNRNGVFFRWGRWLLEKRERGPDVGHRIALVLSFLVAGVLLLLNLDRTLHGASSAQIGYQASQHGWPLIYLARKFEQNIPNHLRQDRQYDWPIPSVAGEIRRWSLINLMIDVAVLVAIIVAVYWGVRRLTG